MRLVMFVRISRCPEYQSSYLPFEENHAQTKCANLTTETVFNTTRHLLRNLVSREGNIFITLNYQTFYVQ